jgi:phage terminase small subunit
MVRKNNPKIRRRKPSKNKAKPTYKAASDPLKNSPDLTAYHKLTPHKQRFIDHFIHGQNGARAYLQTHPEGPEACTLGSASVQAHKWLKDPKILDAYRERKQELANRLAVTTEKIFTEAAKRAFGNINDCLCIDEEGNASIDLRNAPPETRAIITEITQETVQRGRKGKKHDVYRTKIKQADPLKALQLLARLTGMITDKVEHSGPNGGPIKTENVNLNILDELDKSERAQIRAMIQKRIEKEG